jgi:pimeloyl-ACP methyl ester carboxylesterase
MSDAGRARLPDRTGHAVASDGVRLAWDVYGAGDPTIAFLPSTPIVHSRQWKGQVPFLARHHRVVTFDGRGNGRSDRPTDPASYAEARMVADVACVLDATGTGAAVLVGLCSDGVWRAIQLAAAHPERVLGIVAFAPGVPHMAPPHPWKVQWDFDSELPTDEGWAKVNAHAYRRDYADFARFFFSEITSEPHSTRAIEDAVAWALDGDVESMIADHHAPGDISPESAVETCLAVRCPMLLVHGTEDTCQPVERSRRLAALTGAPLVEVEGADHMIPGRHPVLANLLIRDFVRSLERSAP